MSATPAFAATINLGLVTIVNGDASALKTLFTAGASGSKVVGVNATSDDTSARDIQIGITRSGTFYPLGTKSVAITAGQVTGTPAANLLDPSVIAGLSFDSDNQPYLLLKSGDTVQVKSLTTVTAAKTISITAWGGDL